MALLQPNKGESGARPRLAQPFFSAACGCEYDATFRRASENCVCESVRFGIPAHSHCGVNRCRLVILDFNAINTLGWGLEETEPGGCQFPGGRSPGLAAKNLAVGPKGSARFKERKAKTNL